MGRIKQIVKSTPSLCKVIEPFVMWARRRWPGPYRNRLLFRACCKCLPKLKSDLTFIKIGANDGLNGDPCSDLLLEDNAWKGWLVEPVPYLFERLKHNFADSERFRVLQLAVGSTTGSAKFHYIDPVQSANDPNLPYWHDQLGSLDKCHLSAHLGSEFDKYVVSADVVVVTLGDLLRSNQVSNLDLLHIDVEGYDADVLESMDWSICSPGIIFIEHRHVPADKKVSMVELLKSCNYRIYDCGHDYFAIQSAWSDRLGVMEAARKLLLN